MPSDALKIEAALAPNRSTDDADDRTVLLAVIGCAMRWAPEARIIGNVRAGDIERALFSLLEAQATDAQSLTSAQKQIATLTEAFKDVLAHLVAAVSLLERSPKTGAPSNRMFDQMLADYNASIERGRAAYAKLDGSSGVT